MDNRTTQTPAEIASAVKRFAGGRESAVAIADDTGISPTRLRRAAIRLGIDVTDRRRVLRSLHDHVENMKPLDAVDFLLGLCDLLLVDEESTAYQGFRAMGFAPACARILCELNEKRGIVVRYSVLEAVSNPMRDSDADSTRVLKVYLTKIRARLAEIGCPVDITTIWGDGYIMRVPRNYKWDWEVAQ